MRTAVTQPELPGLTPTTPVECLDVPSSQLDALLARLKREGKFIATLDVVGVSSYRATVRLGRGRVADPEVAPA